ncbi:trehalose-phosphatase [Phyllobacterium zundukense]|uniref:Trehalose 6-phosphate phosphatase n=1 Tax=Phyllobacterium zundukense TaxID=1867719 RepID=A0A2N9VTR9_9HYPH|nr:trehalose-phosphatase [Phyllobacterium zundukense]ATU93166.1 trehalose-phosphatase [Phyllobacterium zundukense]PIO42887.1 trehalose-phosphatase [Phyllobacterium zundukense]
MNATSEPLPTDLESWAIFLDIDGTLIDIAETPGAVIVPHALPGQLAELSLRLDGALALVSGRSINSIDELFAPYRFPAAGLHGTEIRREENGEIDRKILEENQLDVARQKLEDLAKKVPDIIVEDKGIAIAVHYRQVPEAFSQVDHLVDTLLVQLGLGWARQDGKMVVEIHPSASSKGTAIAKLMSASPFKGRSPIAVGDDLTDEKMFEFVNSTSGRSIKVGTSAHASVARFSVDSANTIRDWISELAHLGN